MTWYGDLFLFAPNFIRPICDDSSSKREQESDDYLAARIPGPPLPSSSSSCFPGRSCGPPCCISVIRSSIHTLIPIDTWVWAI